MAARLLSLLALVAVVATAAADCGGYPSGHSMCLAAGDSTGGFSGVTAADIADIVGKHNELRQKVANGEETRGKPGPQPAGKNIRELKWNAELATVAQRWADQKTRVAHDCYDCRKIDGFSFVGQNMYASGSSGKLSGPSWKNAVQSWYDEVKDMNNKLAEDFSAANNKASRKGKVIGHYTQVVWADTTEVGCGVFSDNQDCKWMGWRGFQCGRYICNYGIGANMAGDPIYLTSGSCPNGDSTNYPGLCA